MVAISEKEDSLIKLTHKKASAEAIREAFRRRKDVLENPRFESTLSRILADEQEHGRGDIHRMVNLIIDELVMPEYLCRMSVLRGSFYGGFSLSRGQYGCNQTARSISQYEGTSQI